MLKNFGLTEGTSNRHPGQGTANRRFFFKNFFIELLWLENLEEAIDLSIAIILVSVQSLMYLGLRSNLADTGVAR